MSTTAPSNNIVESAPTNETAKQEPKQSLNIENFVRFGITYPIGCRPPSHKQVQKEMSRNQNKEKNYSAKPFAVATEQQFQDVQSQYKAGGIIPYAIHDKKLYILLGKEKRAKSSEETWCEFGGKKENQDKDSIATVAREFCEETIAAFVPEDTLTGAESTAATTTSNSSETTPLSRFETSKQFIEDLLRSPNNSSDVKSFFIPSGKYHLFVCKVPYIPIEQFQQLQQQNSETMAILHTEKSSFQWVEAKGFLDYYWRHETPAAQQYKSYPLNRFFVVLFRSCSQYFQEILLEMEFADKLNLGNNFKENEELENKSI